MSGVSRKFANPMHLSKASSPLHLPDQDAIRRIDAYSNYNRARGNRAVLYIDRLAALPFHGQAVTLPGLSLGDAEVQTPFVDVPFPGDKLVFNPLIFRFFVDERWENYLELQRWLRGISFPEDYAEHRAIYDQTRWRPIESEVSEATVSIMTNAGTHEVIRFNYHHLWPQFLDDVDLQASNDQELTCTVTFRYSTYDIEAVPEGIADG